uniref:Uncharacterized protein n=1 Tax=Lepeophtheirus salmonis TaxID=72036 RepID=A0A0K2UZ66_LEPSM
MLLLITSANSNIVYIYMCLFEPFFTNMKSMILWKLAALFVTPIGILRNLYNFLPASNGVYFFW